MACGSRANVLVVEHRRRDLWRIGEKVATLGCTPHEVGTIEDVVPVARKTQPEVALIHLNFTDAGGGIVAGYCLKEAMKETRIVAYTGGSAGTGLEVARGLGLADRVVTTDGLLENLDEILRHLIEGARADRAAMAALDEAGRPARPPTAPQSAESTSWQSAPKDIALRPIDLGSLHDALDRTVILQLLAWLGGVRPAARALRMPPQSLRWKMEKLGIEWKSAGSTAPPKPQ